jgi:hypothetical protein
MVDDLLALMNEKLYVLQRALILETDAAVKFNLKKQIEELKEQLAACQSNIPRPPQPAPLTNTSPMTSGSRPMKTLKLFYCYSHEDEKLRKKLEVSLAGLKRQKIIDDWHDRKIGLGKDWRDKLNENLKAADIILLLISSDFIASDYCYDTEMKYAMQRHEAGEAVVIPIILRPCVTKNLEFTKPQGAPQDANNKLKAVTQWANQDEAFTAIVERISEVAEEIRNRPPK